jgi:hypothetical protein
MMIVDRRAAHCANSDQRQAVPARDERGPALAAASVARSGQAKVDANASVPPLWTTLDSVGSSREMTASLREATVGDGDSAGAVFRIVHMHRDVVACSMPTTEQIRALVVSRGSSSDRYAAEANAALVLSPRSDHPALIARTIAFVFWAARSWRALRRQRDRRGSAL